jgi:hypothetical protein
VLSKKTLTRSSDERCGEIRVIVPLVGGAGLVRDLLDLMVALGA